MKNPLYKLVIDLIAFFEARTLQGERLVPSSFATTESEFAAWVCFDLHPIMGQHANFVATKELYDRLLPRILAKEEPKFGGSEHTGWGYLENLTKYQSLQRFPIPRDFIPSSSLVKDSENIVKSIAKEMGPVFDIPIIEQQMNGGGDILGLTGVVEVKSRTERYTKYDCVFAEIAERNPHRIYS